MSLIPKKSLGQHFLNSRHVLEQIIEASKIERGETILEIGPGTGILTEALINSGAQVVAVEKDDRAFALLQEKYAIQIDSETLNLIHGDILEMSVGQMVGDKKYGIVANIPYYITGAILQKFLENEIQPNKMVLLVQKEVADRIVAHDGKESILSISVKAFGTPKIVARVPRGAFTPPPNVDSAIISIEKISAEQFHLGKIKIVDFFQILKAGFAHKRKFLIRNLETVVEKEKLIRIWDKLKLNEKVRAEDLALSDWFGVASNLYI